jgi:hypothetical protein
VGQLSGHCGWFAQHRLCDSETFVKAVPEDNGETTESQVRVLPDGADGLRQPGNRGNEEENEAVLDWFHISMALAADRAMSSRIAIVGADSDAELKQLLAEKLPHIRYQLCNGKSHAALERTRNLGKFCAEAATSSGC